MMLLKIIHTENYAIEDDHENLIVDDQNNSKLKLYDFLIRNLFLRITNIKSY